MFNRRALLLSLFAVAVLGTTGCCGRVRNFVYRVRHCPNCAVGFDGPSGYAAPVGYAAPAGFAAPAGDYAPPISAGPVSGCSSCAGGGGGFADHHAGYPMSGFPSLGQPTMGSPVMGSPMMGSGPVFTGPIVPGPVVGGSPPATMAPPMITDKK